MKISQHVGQKREALLDRKPGCVSEARSRQVGGNLVINLTEFVNGKVYAGGIAGGSDSSNDSAKQETLSQASWT